jgi:Phosphodiester glycosidase/S-layer homology domain
VRKYSKKIVYSFIILMVWAVSLESPLKTEAAMVKEQFKVSEGIDYKDVRLSNTITNQAVRVMEINVNNPYTKVEVGVPSSLNKLERTTTNALRNHREGHAVVGAINASFFYSGTAMNLVSKDNRLVHAGEIFEGEDKYVNEPIAFGINANGKGIIDHYQIDMNYIHSGKGYSITSTNKARSVNNTILYTSDFPSNYTNTNAYGTEVVVTLPSAPTLEFGSTVKGTVKAVRHEGDTTKTAIPTNGFVLSGHGTGSDSLKNIKVGDSISLSINVDSKWKSSSFMLASGPMLVKNGKVSLTMDPNSPSARTRAPRTAVAIDRTGEKVFFVTVDGRQSGYSNGMNLTEFAEYLVSLGAYRALNLDGGGSTTMAVRYPGTDKVKVANSPSDGYERSVSTILMAVSTVPKPIFKDVKHSFWASYEIEKLVNKGTIAGYPDNTFRPNLSISRSHAAVLLTRELGLDTSNVTNPGFKDIKPTDKYYKEIAAAENAGLLKGRGKGLFAKDSQLTRAEMAIILRKAFNIPDTDQSYYPDLKSSHWAYSSVNAITHHNIAGGYPDGTFKPNNPVTRAEFSVFLYRAN